MKVTIKDSVLTIEIDTQKPTPSASGKTLVVASTGGFVKTQAQVDGKEVSVSVNATVKP